MGIGQISIRHLGSPEGTWSRAAWVTPPSPGLMDRGCPGDDHSVPWGDRLVPEVHLVVTVFTCLRCREILTEDLSEIPVAVLATPTTPSDLTSGEECPPWLGNGTFAVDPSPFGPPYVPGPESEQLVSAGSTHTILINPHDLVVRHPHPDSARRAGCCGPAGRYGPNLLCVCGAEIATESADCWTAQVVRLEPTSVVRT